MDKAKIDVQKDPKNVQKLKQIKIYSPITPVGQVQSTNWMAARSGLPQSVFHLNKNFLTQN